MPKFGIRSKRNLYSCHPDLISLFEEVVKTRDCSVIKGFRGEEEQNEAFAMKRSSKKFPRSKHNKKPSLAVDVIPYPFKPSDWNDKGKFYLFVGYVKAVADSLDIKIRCGADWDGDGGTKDQNFHDLPHFELIK